MKNQEKLRVAIIGLGEVTRNIHLPAYKILADKLTIVGGCDVDADARNTAQSKFGINEIFDDPRQMIEATAPDIISICTPPFLHYEQTLLALEHNCHVFCEKPVTENLSNAVKMMQAGQSANRLIVVNNQFPYMSIHRGAKNLIGSAEFGKLLFLQAWQTLNPTSKTKLSWRDDSAHGLCFEFGIHVFELVRYFFEAEPVTIYAHIPKSPLMNQTEMLNFISLEFADGRSASIILNRLSKGKPRYLDLRLDGEFASIHTSIGGKVRLAAGIHTTEKRPFFDFNFIKGGSAVLQNGNKSKIIAKDSLNPFATSTAYHFENFINAIQTGKTPPGTIADNLKTLTLVFAAYHSARTKCAVNLAEFVKNELS